MGRVRSAGCTGSVEVTALVGGVLLEGVVVTTGAGDTGGPIFDAGAPGSAAAGKAGELDVCPWTGTGLSHASAASAMAATSARRIGSVCESWFKALSFPVCMKAQGRCARGRLVTKA